MTLRAFLIGLVLAAGLCLLDPYTSFIRSYGWLTVGAFPEGAVFLLVFLTLIVNPLVKLLRRGWSLRRPELLLVWCMVLVASMVPSDGLMRYWPSALAGPGYLSRRPDVVWRETALEAVPEELVLSKNPRSVAAKQYFQGKPPEARLPWGRWVEPVTRWLILMVFLYLAVFFMCAILRRQWTQRERLQFPLARVPLQFTEGSTGEGLLPRLFKNRAFVFGFIVTVGFRLLRALPVFFGADGGWGVPIPLQDIFTDTPLEPMSLQNLTIWWIPVGFAYLVPADVSLSVWFFYVFGRIELQTSAWTGSTLHQGGTWSQLFHWQQAGSYLAFTAGALWMARRHLGDVVRRALGRAPDVDDSEEPVSFPVSFWGFVLCTVGVLWWFTHYGLKVWVAAGMFLLIMVIMFAHARIVAQSGMYMPVSLWSAPSLLHGLGFGVFSRSGAIVANLMSGTMMANTTSVLSTHAINSFRISEVFERWRKLLLPALFAALFVGIGASTYTVLTQGYGDGAANFSDTWGATGSPKWIFDAAHQRIVQPTQAPPGRWTPFSIGVILTSFVMFMRARFYWWPVHPIGLLTISSWQMDRIWVPFLLGWLTKTVLLRFSGRLVRQARYFFIALILVESFFNGVSTIMRTVTQGAFPGI